MSTRVSNGAGFRRPVNSSYLVVGLILLGIAASWLLRETGVLDADGLRWLLPLVLVVAGGAGLLASVVKSATRQGEPEDEGDEPFVGAEEHGAGHEGEEPRIH